MAAEEKLATAAGGPQTPAMEKLVAARTTAPEGRGSKFEVGARANWSWGSILGRPGRGGEPAAGKNRIRSSSEKCSRNIDGFQMRVKEMLAGYI